MISSHFELGPDLQSLDGHFPDDPIVPGVVVLDRAIDAIATAMGGAEILEVVWAKFRAPVRPPARIELVARSDGGQTVHFACMIDGRVVVDGAVRLDRARASPRR